MLADDLRRIRKEAGLQQVDMSAALGVGQGHVSRIENGQATTTEVLERWAETCGAEIIIRRRDTRDPLSPLIEVARGLGEADVALLVRLAMALPRCDPRSRRVLTAAVEAVAEDEAP